jgi:hypothetical protein
VTACAWHTETGPSRFMQLRTILNCSLRQATVCMVPARRTCQSLDDCNNNGSSSRASVYGGGDVSPSLTGCFVALYKIRALFRTRTGSLPSKQRVCVGRPTTKEIHQVRSDQIRFLRSNLFQPGQAPDSAAAYRDAETMHCVALRYQCFVVYDSQKGEIMFCHALYRL